MKIWTLGLAGALALACTLPAGAQTASTLPVKDNNAAVRPLAGQQDAAGAFHYRDIVEGLTSAGAPDPFLSDGSGHQLVTLFGSPTVNLGTIAGVATAAAQASQLAATQAPSNIATGQGSVTTTAAQLVASRTGRRTVTVENTGTTPVYLGGSGVTSTTGFLLPGVAGASLTMSFSGALYAVTASGTAAVTFYETY